MANHKSALKRMRQDRIRRARNRHVKSTLKTMIKKVRVAVDNKDETQAREALNHVVPLIDKAVSKNALHWRSGARKVSRLTKLVNAAHSAERAG